MNTGFFVLVFAIFFGIPGLALGFAAALDWIERHLR